MHDATLTIEFGSLFTEQCTSRVKVDNCNMVVATNSAHSELFESLKSKRMLKNYHVPSNNATTSIVSSSSLASREKKNEKTNENKTTAWCNVEFEVETSANDPMTSNSLDSALSEVATKQVEAFQQRCKETPCASY